MSQPYTNERLAAYTVNTDGSIDTSVYCLQDDISVTTIPSVTFQLTPPSGYEIKGVTPSSGWSSYAYTSGAITITIAVPGPSSSNELDFTISIMEVASGRSRQIDPKFTVRNTTSGV